MKIESVDLFYLSMPKVRDISDGSQDALVVRVRGGKYTGWGECEAAPLVSIANWCCPMSHYSCKPVRDAVLGQKLDSVQDIAAVGRRVRAMSMDILQTDHTLAGVDMALWDLLGKKLGEPVYKLLGFKQAYPKTPYASQLFGDTPDETREKGRRSRAMGFRAAKFGWGPYGHGSVQVDRDHVAAARAGLGKDGILLVDAGTVWKDDVKAAQARLPALEKYGALWLEEPFHSEAHEAYAALSKFCKKVKLAGGEGTHNFAGAKQMIDHAGVGFIQIDAGRTAGISDSKLVADYAHAKGVQFVNHSFQSQLALSGSMQPMAGYKECWICEYPVEPSDLGANLTKNKLAVVDGEVRLPDSPGLGMEVDLQVLRKYLVETEIKVKGEVRYRTPAVD